MTFIVPPCDADIDIVYADSRILVVNKPSGLLSVPGRDVRNRDCLITRLQVDFPEARIVHRLDLSTSGLMVLGLDAEAHRHLSRQFEMREVGKSYQAVVDGFIAEDSGAVDAPLICDWPNRPRQMVDNDNGKPALTHFEVIHRDDERQQTRVRLKPHTGRSHQLRVHMLHLGHPIVGCKFYAPAAVRAQSDRLLLHACELSFVHPDHDERMHFDCQPDF
ncbi:Ribosomal large subunit pseudouridine synthase A [BD1-7 clade bacterium]|uniref:Pseudouridine synthase n=1 Tax=BD1-7 clade bacterium TaxID=2029982 RepID=A0A5S9MV66_9GAMM|nr:Ribosomal large subunit pseudouridine synthase A [BD1-7 clade bacterium]